MGDGTLGSDHVNYLVLRYLQESGFEHAAKSLYREWHRNVAFRDPEDLPFAPVVKQHELIHVIQDGLFHDQLQATVASGRRRFFFTSNNVEAQAQDARQKSFSRRQSTYAANERDDFPLPPPKRVRSGNTDVVTNGDAMDVDEKVDEEDRASVTPSEQDREQSEQPAAAEPIETRVAATQTEKVKKVKTKTLYWALEDSTPVAILQCLWSSTATGSFILAAGESLCRVYKMPGPQDDEQDIDNVDAIGMSSEHCVTAATWHPSGHFFTCAFKEPALIEGDPFRYQIMDADTSGAKQIYGDSPDMFTIALRYTKSGRTLFAASTDGAKSIIQARTDGSEKSTSPPVIEAELDNVVVLDMICISETTFAVCGKGLLSIWSLQAPDGDNDANGVASKLVQVHDHPIDADTTLDKIRFDWRHRVLVAASSSTGSIHTVSQNEEADSWAEGPSVLPPEDAGPAIISALVFQPQPDDHETETPSRLAVSFMGGAAADSICIYAVTAQSCALTTTLQIGPQEPPLALAWAPASPASTPSDTDGNEAGPEAAGEAPARIAAASDEAIRMWDVSVDPPRECLSWKAAPANWYQGDDHHLPNDDEDAGTEPALAWDERGERLAFAVGKKMAVVTILPDVPAQVDGSV